VTDTTLSGPLSVDTVSGARDIREFIELPHRLYRAVPQWVPWFRADMRRILSRRHPFFEHSQAEFFLARRGSRFVARMAALENTRYNAHQKTRCAHFYFFDAEDDPEAAARLFDAVASWARGRGLDTVIGPFGFGGSTGNGILVEGFEHTAAMMMMNWNPPYYARLLEGLGFAKFFDLFSAHLDTSTFKLPDRVRSVADHVIARGRFSVLRFSRKAELKKMASRIGEVYNVSLASDPSHREAYPLSEAELQRATDDLMSVADPSLIKVLAYDGEIVGFVFGFPDVSCAIKRCDGRLGPLAILGLLRDLSRTPDLIINGAGILPRYQRLGGNALLYAALEETARARAFRDVDLVQVADSTSLMLSDIQTLGGTVWKVHRVYTRPA
jgi:GNAT superfamily N-acetyltransferase